MSFLTVSPVTVWWIIQDDQPVKASGPWPAQVLILGAICYSIYVTVPWILLQMQRLGRGEDAPCAGCGHDQLRNLSWGTQGVLFSGGSQEGDRVGMVNRYRSGRMLEIDADAGQFEKEWINRCRIKHKIYFIRKYRHINHRVIISHGYVLLMEVVRLIVINDGVIIPRLKFNYRMGGLVPRFKGISGLKLRWKNGDGPGILYPQLGNCIL